MPADGGNQCRRKRAFLRLINSFYENAYITQNTPSRVRKLWTRNVKNWRPNGCTTTLRVLPGCFLFSCVRDIAWEGNDVITQVDYTRNGVLLACVN